MRTWNVGVASLLLLVAGASGCEKRTERVGSSSTVSPPAGGAKTEIRAVPVSGAIHMLVGRGGNIGVSVGPDGILIIDDKFEPLAPAIRAALGELSRGKLAYVLNTHYHGDHTGGNTVFGKEATLVAHENVRKRLADQGQSGSALPAVTFDSRLSLHFNGEEVRMVHFPHGHTDGDSVIFFGRAGVVHMGDLFFNGRFPFVDLESGGTVQRYVENVGAILEKLEPSTKIIPGHGDLASVSDLKRYHDVLRETVAHVREQMVAGRSLDQIKKAGLPPRYAGWGEGFISDAKWIETIHASYAK